MLDLSIFKLYAISRITGSIIRRGDGTGIKGSGQKTGKKMQGARAKFSVLPESHRRNQARGTRREGRYSF
jgi:hypothetical protein